MAERQTGWGSMTTELSVDTGRGNSAPATIGSNFRSEIERIAEAASYGGFFKVFLNGHEVVNPEDAPELIEAGQRIAITSYDKVGS